MFSTYTVVHRNCATKSLRRLKRITQAQIAINGRLSILIGELGVVYFEFKATQQRGSKLKAEIKMLVKTVKEARPNAPLLDSKVEAGISLFEKHSVTVSRLPKFEIDLIL